jgi:hypothetical protein
MKRDERIGMYRSAFAAGLGPNFTDPSTTAQYEFADRIGARKLSQLRKDRKKCEEWTKEKYFEQEDK